MHEERHTSATQCKAKYVPAEAAEDLVLGELRKWSMSGEEIARVVEAANAQRDTNLDGLRADERALRDRLGSVAGKIQAIVGAIEAGGAFQSLAARLGDLEGQKASVEAELGALQVELATAKEQIM